MTTFVIVVFIKVMVIILVIIVIVIIAISGVCENLGPLKAAQTAASRDKFATSIIPKECRKTEFLKGGYMGFRVTPGWHEAPYNDFRKDFRL